MKTIILATIMIASILADTAQSQGSSIIVDSGLKNPESTKIIKNEIFVANQGEKNWKGKDGDGFISKFDLQGNPISLKFVTGLNDPKGMSAQNDVMAVADITEIVLVDLQSGVVKKRIKTGARFLNGIHVSSDGIAYAADTLGKKVYAVDLGTEEVSVVYESSDESPNGVFVKDRELFIATWANGLTDDWKLKSKGRVIKVNLDSKKILYLTKSGLGNLDGIVPFSAAEWLISEGDRVFMLNEKSGEITGLPETFSDVADIDYSREHKLLAIPLQESGRLIIQQLADLPRAKMKIMKPETDPSVAGSAETFTGSVRSTPILTEGHLSTLVSGSVAFQPGARSAWHTHPKGQLLIVTKGSGLVQEWGMPIEKIRNGDVIWTPPGVKHWHGAASNTAMTHIAIVERLDGKHVDWMEKVTDEDYKKQPK
jgi:quercetin dioxygenase-like cupin family protein